MLASLRHSAKAESAAARARLDLVQAMLLALIAAMFGRLEHLALRHATPHAGPRSAPRLAPRLAQRLTHSPYAVPHNTPGPRRARHRGPVPSRA
jgi:hypothetical protein